MTNKALRRKMLRNLRKCSQTKGLSVEFQIKLRPLHLIIVFAVLKHIIHCESDLKAKPGEYVMLSIKDTGKGMGEKTLSGIFDPFFSNKEGGSIS